MEVRVYPANLIRTAGELEGVGSAVRASSAALRNVAASLAKDRELYAAICSRLGRCADELELCAGKIGRYGSGAAAIAALYESADNSLAEMSAGYRAKTCGPGGGGGGSGRSDEDDPLALKYEGISVGAGALSGSLGGGILVAEGKLKIKSKFDLGKGKSLSGVEVSGDVSLLKGRAEGRAGQMKGGVEASVGKVAAKGMVGYSLMKDGKLSPALKAEASVEAIGLEAKADGQIGTDENNVHASAKGDLGYASAKAGAELSEQGFKAEAGAEAYAAKGEIKGGFTLLGIKIDASVEGKAGGAGIGASADVGSTGASGYLGAGLGLGAGIKIDIDWSEFKLF